MSICSRSISTVQKIFESRGLLVLGVSSMVCLLRKNLAYCRGCSTFPDNVLAKLICREKRIKTHVLSA